MVSDVLVNIYKNDYHTIGRAWISREKADQEVRDRKDLDSSGMFSPVAYRFRVHLKSPIKWGD